MAPSCPSCRLEFGRHGWVAALWINTWGTILSVMAWVIVGMAATGARGGWWVSAGAIAIAIVVPLVGYPYAKSLMVRMLLRLDPPEDEGAAA